MSEHLTRMLAELPSAEPDGTRTERTRMKCHAVLARRAARGSVSRSTTSRRTVQVWELLMAALGVAYLTECIVQAISAYGPP